MFLKHSSIPFLSTNHLKKALRVGMTSNKILWNEAEAHHLQSGRNIGYFGKNSMSITYSIILFDSHFLLLSFQCKPSLWYNLLFSQSKSLWIDLLVLLFRHITGHKLKPKVQQQQIQPHSSHFTLRGRFFLKQVFTRPILILNSSGATFPVKTEGNSASNLLLRPNGNMSGSPHYHWVRSVSE